MADDARNKPLYMISVAAELTGMHSAKHTVTL